MFRNRIEEGSGYFGSLPLILLSLYTHAFLSDIAPTQQLDHGERGGHPMQDTPLPPDVSINDCPPEYDLLGDMCVQPDFYLANPELVCPDGIMMGDICEPDPNDSNQ